MADEITRRLTIWERFGAAYNAVFKGLVNRPREVNHGASWAQPSGARPTFDALNALSAYGVHGYTHAAIVRASQDLAALPLRIVSGRGPDSVDIFDGPFYDLLDQPNSNTDGFLFREQLLSDLILSGNCYILLLGPATRPTSLARLHPAEVRIVTRQDGSYIYKHSSAGSEVEYPADRIVHGRNASWAKGPQGLYGTGAIEPLAKEITADLNAQKLVSKASAQGRPDILLSPRDESDIWGKERRREILSQYQGLAREGGALCLSGAIDVKELQLSPREMEYQAARVMARESVSAVTGVPGSVLGLPTANYATSRQQAINYWDVQRKRGRRMAELLTRIAKLFDPSYFVEHDYTEVEALQSVRTEQLQRVQIHIMAGADPVAAYAAEGLRFPEVQEEVEERIDEDEENVRYLARALTQKKKPDTVAELAAWISKDQQGQTVQGARSALWWGWLERVHKPQEKRLERAVWSYLKGAKKRYRERLREAWDRQKAAGPALTKAMDYTEITDRAEEERLLTEQITQPWLTGWELQGGQSFAEVFQLAGIPIPEGEVFGTRQQAQGLIAKSVQNITKTTIDKLDVIIQTGIVEGQGIDQIEQAISRSTGFDRARARLIARTEATRSVNVATLQAWEKAQTLGIDMQKEWASAQDDLVRELHQELDGQRIGIREEFVVDGHVGPAPGEFADAGMVCNCRCTMHPVVSVSGSSQVATPYDLPF